MGDFNPNSPTLLGAEWRPQTSRNVVIGGSTAIAQRFRPGAVTPARLDAYIAAIASAGFCVEIVDTLVPALDPLVTVFPGSDTGAGGLAAFQDQAAAAATFARVNKNNDDSTYLTNKNNITVTLLGPTFRALTAIAAGKRIVSVQEHVRAWSNAAIGAQFGILTLGGADTNSGLYTPPGDSAFHNYDLTTWYTQPYTNIPWSLTAQTNLLCNGTDRIGGSVAYVNALGIRFSGFWVTVQTVPENRKAFYYTPSGGVVGWQQNTPVGIDGAALAALAANTWYYLVIWAPGSSQFTIPALTDSGVVMAATAAAATGEHRQTYSATAGGSGVLSAAIANPGELVPILMEAPAATFNSQSNPYAALTGIVINTATLPTSQGVTSPGINPYVAVRACIGWETVSQRPDAALTIEIRHGAGAINGGGTLDATATVGVSDLATGIPADLTAFFTSFNSLAATQYFINFKSAATAGKGWTVNRLDSASNTVSGVTAANVEGTGVGGVTDAYDINAVVTTRYDLGALIAAAPVAPGGFTATPKVAA